MTANALVDPIPTPPRRQPDSGASAMVRVVRESWALIESRHDEVARFFYGMLFSLDPATRELFPINMEAQRSRLMRAIVHLVQMIDRPDELVPFLRQLGRDHRKFGVISRDYESVGTALLAAIKKCTPSDAWTVTTERAWAEAYTIMARTMLEAAAADEGPAWWPAQVLEHERLGWDLARIRLHTDYPMPYRPGQYVSVEMPQRARLWRYLTPANAPGDDNIVEFHVRAVSDGWVSRAIVGHARVGDVWRLGPPMGRMGVDRESGRDVLMVAGGTGITPMRAILQELARWGDNPRVHLFFGGRTEQDLYDLSYFYQLANANPWLTVVPVVESDEASLNFERGTLADVVTKYGAWADRDVLVAGSPGMIRSTVSRMLVAGTPLDHITYDPFTID